MELLPKIVNLLTSIVPHHIETSQLICIVNQLTVSIWWRTLVVNGLTDKSRLTIFEATLRCLTGSYYPPVFMLNIIAESLSVLWKRISLRAIQKVSHSQNGISWIFPHPCHTFLFLLEHSFPLCHSPKFRRRFSSIHGCLNVLHFIKGGKKVRNFSFNLIPQSLYI